MRGVGGVQQNCKRLECMLEMEISIVIRFGIVYVKVHYAIQYTGIREFA